MWHPPCSISKWERVGSLPRRAIDSLTPRDSEKTADLLERNGLLRNQRCRVGHRLTVQDMNFISYKPTQHETTLSPLTELTSIGCEAWIDVSRFSSRENSARPINGDVRTPGDHSRSPRSHGSLTKSLAGLGRKFRRRSDEDLE
jgi:hypothetical protein